MGKPYWNLFRTGETRPWPKVGVAFMNKDGSYNLRIKDKTTLTVADKIQMREGRQKGQFKDKAKEQGVEAAAA